MIHPYYSAVTKSGKWAVMLQKSIFDMGGTDVHTGLHNRHTCSIVLEYIIHEYFDYGFPFTIAIGDIDHFKLINDTYGHLAGDQVLKAISLYVNHPYGTERVLFRWGSEEFLFIYKQAEKLTAATFLKNLQMQLNQSVVRCEGQEILATMTFGLADCHESIQFEELIALLIQICIRQETRAQFYDL